MLGISYYAMNQWQVASEQHPPTWRRSAPGKEPPTSTATPTGTGGSCATGTRAGTGRQVMTVQHGVGERGAIDPNSGDAGVGPGDPHGRRVGRGTARRSATRSSPIPWMTSTTATGRRTGRSSPCRSCPRPTGAARASTARGNFEGFVRAASKQKWLEVHGDRALDALLHRLWAQPPEALLRLLPEGSRQRLGQAAPRPAADPPREQVRPAVRERVAAGPHAVDEALPGSGRPDAATGTGCEREQGRVQGAQRRGYLPDAPFEEETEITGPVAAEAVSFLLDDRCRRFPRRCASSIRRAGRSLSPPRSSRARRSAQGWLRASHRKLDPKLTTEYRPYHTHDEVQPLLPGKLYELAVEIWPTCIVVPAGYRIALTLQGKDFERPGDTGGSLGTVEQPMRGSGPFTHTNPMDRPAEIFDNMHTVFGGGAKGSYLLLPIIPSKA